VIFLFNVGGYHFVFWALRSQAKRDLLVKLDAEAYSSQEVVVLTVPISLPYPIHDPNYQRADGEVEHNGEFYLLVKQKVENDTLYMVCIKDHGQRHIQRTMNDYTKLSNNLPANTKHAMDLLGKMFKDFTPVNFSTSAVELALSYNITFGVNDDFILNAGLPVDSPPPEMI
jgi:hypothetical protein